MEKIISNKLVNPKVSGKLLVGWHEWCQLPKLHLPAIKAKVDTGAKTSALHAFNIKPFRRKGVLYVRFHIHPIQSNNDVTVESVCRVVDQRRITSSNGHNENRYVIITPITMGGMSWEIELTLSNRDPLKFRMLLGREALRKQVIIDPGHALCQGKISKQELQKLY